MPVCTRIFYRNHFLHLGHLQTLYFNDNFAKNNKGVCYAIIDDRRTSDEYLCSSLSDEIQEDFDYLGLTNTKIVSVSKNYTRIINYTKGMINEGKIYIHRCTSMETIASNIIKHIDSPHTHFRLMLKSIDGSGAGMVQDYAIGYTKEQHGYLSVVLSFDFIIKVLDNLLNITDIVMTSVFDNVRNTETYKNNIEEEERTNAIFAVFNNKIIKYHHLETYKIIGFKYSKKNWPVTDERDPYLLTIKGLKARAIPKQVLRAFYFHATQMGIIKIAYLDSLLRTYLYKICDRVFGVMDPIMVKINNWADKKTEFICKPVNPLADTHQLNLCALSNILYIDKADFGIDCDTKLTRGRSCRLRHSNIISCTDIEVNDKGPICIYADYLNDTDRSRRCIHWISSEWGQTPIKVCFLCYNWFYTGLNTLMTPQVTYGYLESHVFNDLSKIYQLERNGYFIYSAVASIKASMPTFIRICKI